jgi:Thiamine pyrophosphate-requiring enzymes [acetolactate synthase, pyruvate dehydrogenase (cytochrome), glyoxylate carboligase, phosphonopyruvate decarboxylase]
MNMPGNSAPERPSTYGHQQYGRCNQAKAARQGRASSRGIMSKTRTVANLWAERLASYGVKRFFGVPGGDCSLDIIQAAADHGIDFILTRAEAAATIMAATTGEITGTPGVVMTSRGPGIANAMNGIAYAALDRAPVLVVADAYDSSQDHVAHQRFDQAGMLKPLIKAHDRLGGEDAGIRLDRLVETALSAPPARSISRCVARRSGR